MYHERGKADAAHFDGPGRERQDHRRAESPVPGCPGAAPGADDPGTAVPRGRAGPVQGGRPGDLPAGRGAVLQPPGQSGVPGRRWAGLGGAGRGRTAAADVSGGAGDRPAAESLWPPFQASRLSSISAGYGGRAEKLPGEPGAAHPGGGGGRGPRRGQAHRPGAHLRGLRGPGGPDGPGPQRPAHPGGGQADPLSLGLGEGPVAGRLH